MEYLRMERNPFWRSSSSTSLIKQVAQGLGLKKKIKGNLIYKITGIILYCPPPPPSLLGEDAENKRWYKLPILQNMFFLDFPISL